jgi:hypothetical protein
VVVVVDDDNATTSGHLEYASTKIRYHVPSIGPAKSMRIRGHGLCGVSKGLDPAEVVTLLPVDSYNTV